MKKEKVITFDFGSNSLNRVSAFLYSEFYKKGKPLDRVACVFGGKRPALFLRKALAEKIKKGFLGPVCFSMNEFMEYIVSPQPLAKISQLESYYLIYRLCQKLPLFKNFSQTSFSEFLSWAKEIVSFIEQLDLEDIPDSRLLNLEKSAAIGYDIPAGINRILENITKIRRQYRQFLSRRQLWSRGLVYLEAKRRIKQRDFSEFDKILFCNFFHLSSSESQVFKVLAQLKKSTFIFEGSDSDWPALKANSVLLGSQIRPGGKKKTLPKLHFFQGPDTQAQVSLAARLLAKIKDKSSTLVVLSNPESLLPFVLEAGGQLGEFNVSLGYPLNKSLSYSFFKCLFEAQKGKKNNQYYCRDYLKLLRHPFVKNIDYKPGRASSTRILSHKIEEALNGTIDSCLGGSLFVSLAAIEGDSKIEAEYKKTLAAAGQRQVANYREITGQIHSLLFTNWEKINNFSGFGQNLSKIFSCLADNPLIANFPLEEKAFEALYRIEKELSSLTFSRLKFDLNQMWEIFCQRLDLAKVSFSGSPLLGAQVLGLLETRSLQFKNVFFLDANEGFLPKLSPSEPLIPSEVMASLGLGRLKQEEEIQRYNFSRLINSANQVYFIWSKNQFREKSRFLESLIWEKEKKQNQSGNELITKVFFPAVFSRSEIVIEKSPAVIKFLKNMVFSASRLNTYLDCPLRFYYKYVLKLNKKEDLLQEVDSSQIGSFIHQLLFTAYKLYQGKKPLFNREFKNYLKKLFELAYQNEIQPRMQPDYFLLKKIIWFRLQDFLKKEKQREKEILKIEALEEKYPGNFQLGRLKLNFNSIVDRVDFCRGNRVEVIDYKTGSRDIIPAKTKTLSQENFSRQNIKETVKSFQLPLYAYFVQKRYQNQDLGVYVYNLRSAEYIPFLDLNCRQDEKILDYCLEALKFILSELFDAACPFSADKSFRGCAYCEFKNLC